MAVSSSSPDPAGDSVSLELTTSTTSHALRAARETSGSLASPDRIPSEAEESRPRRR